ncbi:hypothetical protein GCM10025856_02900 [Methylophaga marina]|uniref:DUF3530 family protein n=2 Tax=Methylophaga TaxID=40222 RepID=A0ABP3CZ74_9GAMM|nr:hypothetical protein GCM10025856_02900 [Methylophaga marina]
MELDLRKRLKFIALLLMTVYLAQAQAADETETPAGADDNETVAEENSPIMLREQGNVEGYVALTVSEQSIDATYMPDSLGKSAGKVLILHGRGQDIDSDGIVRTLRTGLSKAGWSTMTVALHYELTPNLYLAPSNSEKTTDTDAANTSSDDSDDAEQPAAAETETATEQSEEPTEAAADDAENQTAEGDGEQSDTENTPYIVSNEARIAAAMSYLAEKQDGPTAIIGFGEAANLANESFSMASGEVGIVWINTDIELTEPPKVKVILDLIAERPLQTDIKAVQRKANMRKANVNNYEQRKIITISPSFYGAEANVLGIVRGWLHKHFIAEDDA